MSMRFKATSPSAVSSQSLPNSKISDTISIASTTSAFSTGPDRHGFYGGTHFTDKPKVPLSKAQILAREKKWLHMLDHWYESTMEEIQFFFQIFFFISPFFKVRVYEQKLQEDTRTL
jgi:hypothetical protein